MRSSTYFFTSSTHIKVGCTADITQRLWELRNYAGSLRIRPRVGETFDLSIFGTLPDCGYAAEASAKRMLRAHRDVGEWFFLRPESLAIIRSMPKFREYSR